MVRCGSQEWSKLLGAMKGEQLTRTPAWSPGAFACVLGEIEPALSQSGWLHGPRTIPFDVDAQASARFLGSQDASLLLYPSQLGTEALVRQALADATSVVWVDYFVDGASSSFPALVALEGFLRSGRAGYSVREAEMIMLEHGFCNVTHTPLVGPTSALRAERS